MITECQRCGTCCRKGPPALHGQDVELYVSGVLGKQDLLTLRRGEWVYDSVQDALMALPEEIVRIKAGPGGQSCHFLSAEDNACRIYEQRPLECRAMKCWDPGEFESIYQQGRIGRMDLIPPDSALGEIVADHEARCAYERIGSLAERVVQSNDAAAAAELAAIIQQDEDTRAYLRQQTEAGEDVLNFLFGRPVARTLPAFGLQAKWEEGTYRFFKVGNPRLRRLVLS